jgi:hypothetical protein
MANRAPPTDAQLQHGSENTPQARAIFPECFSQAIDGPRNSSSGRCFRLRILPALVVAALQPRS